MSLVQEIEGRFRSENNIPVERIVITAEMWERMKALLQDGERWNRYNNAEHDVGNGEMLKTHINIGINVWREKEWLAFHECSPEEFEEIMLHHIQSQE